MKKWLIALALVLAVSVTAVSAQPVAEVDPVVTEKTEVSALNLTEVIKKLPNLKQGVSYSMRDSEFNYLSTLTVLEWKKVNGEIGYSANEAAVAVLSIDLLEAKDYISVPILDLVTFKPGIYAGFKRLTGTNDFDWGISATLLDIKF